MAPAIKDSKELRVEMPWNLSLNLVHTYWNEEVLAKLDDTLKNIWLRHQY